MYTWAALVLIGIGVGWSIWLRVCHCRANYDNMPQVEPRPSPFSEAVQELIGTAGGVYLSLVMVVSFLKIDLPEKITLDIISFDPLAMAAIGVAVIQPWLRKLISK